MGLEEGSLWIIAERRDVQKTPPPTKKEGGEDTGTALEEAFFFRVATGEEKEKDW